MFYESRRDVVISVTVVGLKSTVQILRYPFRSLRQYLFITVGLRRFV